MTDDHEARMLAKSAHDRIDGHERLCSERWEQSRKTGERIEHGVSGLYKRWWQIAVAVILMLLGMVGSALYIGAQINKISGGIWP